MSTKQRNLDLFKLLGELTDKHPQYYQQLSEQEQKEVLPLIIMRWMSGTSDPMQIYLLNELVNPFIFEFYKDKQLLLNLLTISSTKYSKRYFWNKTKSKKSSTAISIQVIKQYFDYNTRQAQDALSLLTKDDIIDYAIQLGYQPDQLNKIAKELK